MKQANQLEQSATGAGKSPSRAGRFGRRLPLLLAVALVASFAARYSQVREKSRPPQEADARQTADAKGEFVSLVIRFADGRERKFAAIPWRPKITIDDLMTAASRLPAGITYSISGDGEQKTMAMIDDVYDEWGGGRFWLVQVDGVPVDDRLANFELQPGESVLWTFERRK